MKPSVYTDKKMSVIFFGKLFIIKKMGIDIKKVKNQEMFMNEPRCK